MPQLPAYQTLDNLLPEYPTKTSSYPVLSGGFPVSYAPARSYSDT